MSEVKYIYGPIPSRRLGKSLGISPIPRKACNYSCIYCQLGRTNMLGNTRKLFFPVKDIIDEFINYTADSIEYDVISIVGEGEPTLYLGLGELIVELKKLTNKPVAVITNGALLYDENVRNELMKADIVLPSFCAYNPELFKKINRPFGRIGYQEVFDGLVEFSKNFKGQIWLEIMLMKGINDSDEDITNFKNVIKEIRYDALYLNTPVRPPAEDAAQPVDKETMEKAVNILDGVSISLLSDKGFFSSIKDEYEAVISIIKRHPMNQFELTSFLESRNCKDIESLLERLEKNDRVKVLSFKGIKTYRFE